MIKSIIFDLDGVLFDGVLLHTKLFLDALKEIQGDCDISFEYHSKYLNGLSTRQKIDYLVKEGILDENNRESLANLKQINTNKFLLSYKPASPYVYNLIKILSEKYTLYCASNSKRETLDIVLKSLNIYNFFKDTISNDDIQNPKPSSDPYNYILNKYSLSLEETLILEDSNHGKISAYGSGCHVMQIVDPTDVTLENIKLTISRIENREENAITHVNIVVPMAGHGSRFSKNGYTIPKPFIPVFGKPMIHWVIENMMPKDELYGEKIIKNTIVPHFHFVAQATHLKVYDLSGICKKLNIDYTISCVDKVTEGPACTVLLTEKYINNDWPLITVNSDQYLEWDINNFYRSLLNPSFDGCINTFNQPNEKDIKWSYVKVNSDNDVIEVAEKKWLSPLATTGIYGWKKGSDFVKYAKQMITENNRVNNEFYVCPVYNYLIRENRRVRYFSCKKLWGLGVPEDLENFIKYYAYE